MNTILAIATIAAAILAIPGAIVGVGQLRRKRALKPYMPTSLMIVGVPMHHGRDLPGYGW